jgi:hypothetical protein
MKVIFNEDGTLLGVFIEQIGIFNQGEFEDVIDLIKSSQSYDEIIRDLENLGLKKVNDVEEINL